jgi:hypothetical protein
MHPVLAVGEQEAFKFPVLSRKASMTLVVGCLALAGLGGGPSVHPLRAQVPALEEYVPRLQVGVGEGRVDEVFGNIQDIAATEDGSFLVLDNRLQTLRLYGRDGDLRASAGRAGRGPFEFLYPESVDIGANGIVTVLDRGNGRLMRWRLDGGELTPESTTRIPFQGYDHCSLDGRDFVVGAMTEGSSGWGSLMVHELGRDGTVVRSFGPAEEVASGFPEPFRSVANRNQNQGPLECDAKNGRVYWLSSGVGVLQAFTADGTLLWRTAIPGFLAVEPMMTERGTMVYRPRHGSAGFAPGSRGAGSWTVGSGVTAVADETLLVQLDSLWYPILAENRKTFGILVDASTGEADEERFSLPRVGDAARDWLFTWSRLPYPRVTVYAGRDPDE